MGSMDNENLTVENVTSTHYISSTNLPILFI